LPEKTRLKDAHYITIAHMKFAIYQSSRIGGRKYNQDRTAYAYSDKALLLVLADGMGGHLHGELAAQMAVQTFVLSFERAARPRVPDPELFLREIMKRAHMDIIRYAREQKLAGNPGTTCVAVLVQDDKMYCAHAGDSRLYMLRDGKVVTRTRDHSLVQQWADWGVIKSEEMKTHPDRNRITNCLGGSDDMFYVESAPVMPLQTGDVMLLCSDGLWGPLEDAELATEFLNSSLQEKLEHLMGEAIGREGVRADNTTAVVARWGDGEDRVSVALPVSQVLDCG
jgi:PPM family protein phosphatase